MGARYRARARVGALLGTIALVGCAPSAQPAASAPVPPCPVCTTPETAAVGASGAQCWAKGRPSPLPGPTVDEHPYCHGFDARLFAGVEGDEDGEGHGGSLRLARFTVGADRVDVRVIESSHSTRPGSR